MSLSTEPTPVETEALPLESRATDRMTHYRWVILALIFFGTTINYMDRLVMAVLYPTDLQQQYSITSAQWGYIGSAFGLAYAFGQFFSGSLLDKIGTRFGYALALGAWSVCAMLTGLGRGALSFGVLRAMLGVSESPAFPAAAKTCAEWFPKRQRAFAFGFVNAGTNMGAIAAPLIVPILAVNFGWQWAFIATGAMGFILLAFWLTLYHRPEEHPHVSQSELALIHSDPPEPAGKAMPGVLDLRPFSFQGRLDTATYAGICFSIFLLAVGVGPLVGIVVNETRGTPNAWIGWITLTIAITLPAVILASSSVKVLRKDESSLPTRNLVGYRSAWVFALGKFITDPMWWFYMTWLPKFLNDRYHLDLGHIGPPLIVIYAMSDVGSIAGGWVSSTLLKRGYTVNIARKSALLLSSLFVIPIVLAQHVESIWTAVFILGLVTAGHQAFSSNLYTLCSDLFPKRAVGSVAGFGGSFGWIGAALFQSFVGLWVQYTNNYTGPFIAVALAYLFAFVVIHLLSPRLAPAVIDDSN